MIQMFGEKILPTIANLRLLIWSNQYSKKRNKEEFVQSGYRIIFDSTGWWGFNNDTTRDVIVFGVDNN